MGFDGCTLRAFVTHHQPPRFSQVEEQIGRPGQTVSEGKRSYNPRGGHDRSYSVLRTLPSIFF